MTLQFLRSMGQTDVEEKMIQTAKEWLKQDPQHRVFFIVPNYNKFEQEIQLLSGMKKGDSLFSTIATQVFSFNRLAWYFLQKEGKIPRNTLTEAGNAMVLRKVLTDLESQLIIFRGEINKVGFIEQLANFYQEMQLGNLTIADLVIDDQKTDAQLKLQDLQKIFAAYEKALVTHHVENTDPLALLTDYLTETKLPKALFIVSGFTRFNGKELAILQVLMTQSQLLVSLELDQKYTEARPDPLNLFYDAGSSYFQLLNSLPDRSQTPVKTDLVAHKNKTKFNDLADFWAGKKVTTDLNSKVQLRQFVTIAEEVRQVGDEIRRLIKEENYRYQDIQLLIRDVDQYRSSFETLFPQLEIPYYLDEDQSMAEHPLLEFLQALFLIDQTHYQIKDVIRLLRTELFVPLDWEADSWQGEQKKLREKIDQTENVALAYNFRGSYWTRKADWVFVDYDFEAGVYKEDQKIQAHSNEVRQLINQHLPNFFKKIKQASNGREAATVFYQFLETSGAKRQLLFWRDQEVNRGNLEKARNHEQTWQALMDLLDEYVLIYGDEVFDWQIFQEIFLAGLMNLNYGKIPTSIDQVRVNDLELARVGQAKITFALGLNDRDFPASFDDHGLLSPEERELLQEQLPAEKYLPETNSSKIMREPYVAYSVFLSATEKLYLSFAVVVADQVVAISPYLMRLSKNLKIPLKQIEPLNLKTQPPERVGTLRTMVTDLITLERLAQDKKAPLYEGWRRLEQLLQRDQAIGALATRVFNSLTATNLPKNLSETTALGLYGKEMYLSVSRIEDFYNCQFKYFANFGLKLKERTLYGLDAAGKGDFYHEALDSFFRLLKKKGLELNHLSDTERLTLAEEVLQEIYGEAKFAILSSSPRMNYIRYQLAKTIQKVSWGLLQQSRRTKFKTQQTEVIFGQIAGEKGLPGLVLPLNNGGYINLRGKIDRIDLIDTPEKEWFSVVDYKSSSRNFKLLDAFYGTALQLITYLDVAIEDFATDQQKEVKPAGAYYFHVKNPILKSNQEIEANTLNEFMYQGLFTKDPDLFEEMDPTIIGSGLVSQLFPIKESKGKIVPQRQKDNFFASEEIELLRRYNRQRIQQAGNQISSGELKLNPVMTDDKKRACAFCPFQSICEFDVMLENNQYKRFEKMKRQDILNQMEEALDDGENS